MAKKKEAWEDRELQRRRDREKDARVFTEEERKEYLARCKRLREMVDDGTPVEPKSKKPKTLDEELSDLLKG